MRVIQQDKNKNMLPLQGVNGFGSSYPRRCLGLNYIALSARNFKF
jgi:hypothetical protein